MSDTAERVQRVGLCATCRHSRRIVSSRESEFWLCGKSATDERYKKYPPLPVRACAGHEPGIPTDSAG